MFTQVRMYICTFYYFATTYFWTIHCTCKPLTDGIIYVYTTAWTTSLEIDRKEIVCTHFIYFCLFKAKFSDEKKGDPNPTTGTNISRIKRIQFV